MVKMTLPVPLLRDERGTPCYVFVSGPYTDPVPDGVDRNVVAAIRAGGALRDAGLCPFVPHLTDRWHALLPRDYEDWIAWCLAWLERCDAVLRLPGASPGADRECRFAAARGIQTFDDAGRLTAWARENWWT